MRILTCLQPKVLFFVVLTLALLVGTVRSGIAQESPGVVPTSYESGSFFNQKLGTALRFNYHSHGYGIQDDVFSLGAMKIVTLDEESTVFLDGQGTLSDDFGGGFNLGVGYRQMTMSGSPLMSVDPQRILGLGFWTDGQSTASDNFFTQLGFSLESLGDSFDMRLNGHFPLERSKFGDATLTTFDSPTFVGNNLVSQTSSRSVDTAHSVIDAEFAKRITNLEAWAFIGGYQLGGGDVDATGYRLGVRGYAVPDLALSLQLTDDDQYATNVMFGVTWFIGRTNKCNGPCGTLRDRFREPVLRNDFIATTRRIEVINGDVLTDATSGEILRFVHVDSTGSAGDGTFENPLNEITGVGAASQADDTILVHAGSTLNGNYTALEGQRILGEGGGIQHTVNTSEVGLFNLPETTTGALSGTIPTINGSGDVFTLANDNELNNFSINGGARAVIANGVNAPVMRNLDIAGITGNGIEMTNVTGTSEIENTVTITDAGGVALLVDGGSDTANLAPTITNAADRSVIVRNRAGGTLTMSGTVTDTGEGVLVENNSAGDINISGALTLTTGASDAVVTRNNTGATVTFADLNATTTTGDTMRIEGGGTVSVNGSTSTLTSAGTGSALIIRGDNFAGASGDATVNIAAAIANSGGGRSVDIQDRTANDVILSGTVTDTSQGVLVQDNSGGAILFSGAMTLDTGSNTAVRVASNTGAAINFVGGMDIDTLAGTGFFADGGGTISAIGTNTIDTTTGIGLDVQNMTIGAANLQFDSVNVNGATTGINLDTLDGDGEVRVGSGIVAGAGGTLTVTGTAVQINEANQVTLSNVTVANTAAGANGVIASNSAGKKLFVSGLNVTTDNIGVSSTGAGELSATASNNITTTSGTALKIDGNVINTAGATFDNVSMTAGTTTAIDLANTTGGTITVGPNSGTAGDGGTIVTTGTAIKVSNVRSAVFNDVVATSSTRDTVVVDADNVTGRMDLTLSNNLFTSTGGDDSAFAAVLDDGTGDVRFLFNDGNTFASTSIGAGNATFDVQVTSGLELNANITDNTFSNGNAGGTAFAMQVNDGTDVAKIDLNLTGNTANVNGVLDDYDLTNSDVVNSFRVVDGANATTNNDGTVNFNPNMGAFDTTINASDVAAP